MENLEFYKTVTKEIKPQIKGSDVLVCFRKLKIKSIDTNSASPSASSIYVKINREVMVTFHEFTLFESIQKSANLSLELFKQSLHPKHNEDMIFAAGEGAGRSGSFFFFSHDKRFIIKTMTSGELSLMKKILPAYVEHFKAHPYSLIAKIFGIFTVKV